MRMWEVFQTITYYLMLGAGFSFLIFKTFKMKKEYFKIAKKIGVEIIEYKSYMSDL